MNSTCQIHKGFDPSYIVLSRTLDRIALCDHCEHLRVARIARNSYCEHPTDYGLRCTCDTVRLVLNTTPPLQGFRLKTLRSSPMPPQHTAQISNPSVCC